MGLAANGLHALIDAHYEALYRYAYRLTGSAADAEDLTQEAFGKAFVRMGQLREADRARAWLFRILRNLYLHKVRDDKRHRIVPLDAVGDLPGRDADPTPDIDPAKLQQAIDQLDEGFRTPLILFYFEEFSYRDIAEQMELPIGTVMSRLARAKAYLRTMLSPPNANGSHGEAVERSERRNEKEAPSAAVPRAGNQVL
ncbi:RNA polymerase sigma factor [Gemmata sp.]|uniref:RNA polymerase sigma factor n=1 Tax=Gemmata sp. TaxID=1914242 RepID=UPI003F6FA83E